MTQPDTLAQTWPASRTVWISASLCGAMLLIHLPRWVTTYLAFDDFQILTESWPWEVTRANLWFAANEHAMPAGRLTTSALVEFTPLTWLPWAAGTQGPLAVLLGMVLLYHFVARERGHPVYGLVAMALFGVSSQYHEAVSWFAASFSILSLDSLLLALLAAQSWRRSGKVVYLGLAALACALSPCWFAIGILAGPLCAVYLAFPRADTPSWRPRVEWRWPAWTPLLGTALFLAFSIPLTSKQIMGLEHYGEKTAAQSFDLVGGFAFTMRALTDNVVFGNFGLPAFPLSVQWTYPLAALWLALFVWWWLRSPQQGLCLLGLAFILSSYLLTYSARARMFEYEFIIPWSRYNLFAQMGFALIVAGGIPDGWGNGYRRGIWVVGAIVLLTFIQFPRAWPRYMSPQAIKQSLSEDMSPNTIIWMFQNNFDEARKTQAKQRKDLARIEEVDRLCREHRISAAQARETLPEFIVEVSSPKANGWKFLRGCDDCVPRDPAEVRRLLDPPPDTPPPNR